MLDSANPHAEGTRTYAEYEAYKTATTLGEVRAATKSRIIVRDYMRGRLSLRKRDLLSMVDPILALLTAADVPSIVEGGRVPLDGVSLTASRVAMLDIRGAHPRTYDPYDGTDREGPQYSEYTDAARPHMGETNGGPTPVVHIGAVTTSSARASTTPRSLLKGSADRWIPARPDSGGDGPDARHQPTTGPHLGAEEPAAEPATDTTRGPIEGPPNETTHGAVPTGGPPRTATSAAGPSRGPDASDIRATARGPTIESATDATRNPTPRPHPTGAPASDDHPQLSQSSGGRGPDGTTGQPGDGPNASGIRAAVLSFLSEANRDLDGMSTAEAYIEAMTVKADAALRSVAPVETVYDANDHLVASVMADSAFKDGAAAGPLRDPANMAEYRACEDRLRFRSAMYDEVYQIMDEFGTVEHATVDDIAALRADGRTVRVVPSKGVFERKYMSDSDGSLHRHKYRWCACEAVGRYFVEDTYSPAVSIESIRLLFVLAAVHGMDLCNLDVHGAYLCGERSDDEDVVFIRMPPGMDEVQEEYKLRHGGTADPDDPAKTVGGTPDPRLDYTDARGRPKFYRVVRNLHGLQSAGMVFYRLAKAWLLELGFQATSVDPCVFYRRTGDGVAIIGLYVDDLLVLTSDTATKEWFMQAFADKFRQSPDPGDDSFLSIAYRRDGRKIHVDTPKLWRSLENLLSGVDLPRRAGAPLPADALEMLCEPPDPDTNPIVPKSDCDVRAILGTVMWGVLACRPAEAFAVAALARHVHRPTRNVVSVLMHLCAFLLARKDDEMTIDPDAPGPPRPTTYVDSSWGNDPSTMRSWFGYCIMWAGFPFAFRAKLGPSVALSSRDAEAVAACFAIKAIIAVAITLSEMGFDGGAPGAPPCPFLPMPLMVDNMPVVTNANSDRIHRDSRHMALRLAWIRQQVTNSMVSVRHVVTSANVADVFTKVLPPSSHSRFRDILMGTVAISTIAMMVRLGS